MKNVILATLEYPPQLGGIATYLSYFAERFPSGRVTVIAPEHKGAHESDMRSPAIIYRHALTSGRMRPRWLLALYWTWWHCKKERPDALIVSHVLPMGQVARFVKRTLGIPYAVVIHGMDVASAAAAGGRKREAARRVLKDAALVVANSTYTSTWLEAFGVDGAKSVVIPPPPSLGLEETADPDDRRTMRRRLGVGPNQMLLLSVGRLVTRKGFDVVLKAVAALKARGRMVRYAIVGEGPDRERLEALAEELGVRDAVTFQGALDTGELSAAYAAADAFIMVPRAEGPDIEGYGIVYLEAGLMGAPVIGSRSGGVPEAVKDGETGILVDPDDVEAVADAVERLADDEALRRRMGESGRARVIEEFGAERQAKRFMAAIKQIMA